MVTGNGSGDATALAEPTNDAEDLIVAGAPYIVTATIEGTAPILFHRWSVEAVAEKAASAKGSAAKKTDDIESYVYRDENGVVCLPGEYLRQSMVAAAKFRQDPRSPRKSAMDLYKAAVVPLTILGPITNAAGETAKTWDFVDQRRVTVQRAGITRSRPGFHAGWRATIEMQVLLPEYVSMQEFRDVLGQAGRLIGTADFRPTYGRYQIVSCQQLAL
jgi:hypothetical protein